MSIFFKAWFLIYEVSPSRGKDSPVEDSSVPSHLPLNMMTQKHRILSKEEKEFEPKADLIPNPSSEPSVHLLSIKKSVL